MSDVEYRFLSFEDVLELHEMQLARYGGAVGIRDSGLLQSAVMMPQASFDGQYVHNDIYKMAAAYAFRIAENQPFLDGNKRTALSAGLVFLDWQQIEIADPGEQLYNAMIGLSQKKLDKTGLATLFKKLAKQNEVGRISTQIKSWPQDHGEIARKDRLSKKKANSKRRQPLPPVHPWRVCPYGEHWVRTHSLRVPLSKTHPEGSITTRHEHCAHNPSGKDQLYPEEIQEIAKQNFSGLKNKPCPLPSKFRAQGSKYDDFIAGWVQYWNDVLKPDEPLDPNLVKALIASESSFNPNKLAKPKDSNSARGLMQITSDTRKILDNHHGDIKDHLITVTKKELNDPNVNICAGVRWLFEKRRLASSHQKKAASWVETVWEYQGVKRAKTKEEAEKIKKIFNGFYEEFQKCGKS